mmetsp:Transcript_68499/g.110408  ORF Transcript_68499/g.110408 Transcript_68499/m.110408 type:complete len:348 (-) Transcript_68499:63-1106(-)
MQARLPLQQTPNELSTNHTGEEDGSDEETGDPNTPAKVPLGHDSSARLPYRHCPSTRHHGEQAPKRLAVRPYYAFPFFSVGASHEPRLEAPLRLGDQRQHQEHEQPDHAKEPARGRILVHRQGSHFEAHLAQTCSHHRPHAHAQETNVALPGCPRRSPTLATAGVDHVLDECPAAGTPEQGTKCLPDHKQPEAACKLPQAIAGVAYCTKQHQGCQARLVPVSQNARCQGEGQQPWRESNCHDETCKPATSTEGYCVAVSGGQDDGVVGHVHEGDQQNIIAEGRRHRLIVVLFCGTQRQSRCFCQLLRAIVHLNSLARAICELPKENWARWDVRRRGSWKIWTDPGHE